MKWKCLPISVSDTNLVVLRTIYSFHSRLCDTYRSIHASNISGRPFVVVSPLVFLPRVARKWARVDWDPSRERCHRHRRCDDKKIAKAPKLVYAFDGISEIFSVHVEVISSVDCIVDHLEEEYRKRLYVPCRLWPC